MNRHRPIPVLVFLFGVAACLGGLGHPAGALAQAAWPAEEAGVSFELDVMPILTARGCNMGACHGKARGQNGFQLSLLGFDPEFDYAALTKEARGRRVFPAAPDRSLLTLKASARLAHGGGQRIEPSGRDEQTLLRWIASGMPRRLADEPKLESVRVTPTELRMKPGDSLAMKVEAVYSNGQVVDVTARSSYQSNESGIVAVDDTGLIQAGPIPGEATIMARYMGLIATCNVLIPLAGEVPADLYAGLPRHNFIDDLVWKKLQSLGITPSAPTDDSRFLRRAFIDIIGRVPTPDEVRQFTADTNPEKRAALVDSLLERPEYADHWANKWADLLRPNPYRVGLKATLNYDAWIRDSFRKNKPYDQFVRELVTAEGSTWENGAATLFRDRRDPDEIGTLVSQLFLGVRLDCAKCHHHPFEKWGQEHFYSFAAYFARVGRKGTGLSPPISGGEEIVMAGKKGDVSHPLTGEVLAPQPLFGEARQPAEDEDRRHALAEWITSDDNHYFREVIANRIWADMMGRGLVEPVDDLRATNPPTNPELLAALGNYLKEQNYDLKQLIRTIATSYVYGLSSEPSDRNVADTQNYSRHYRQRLRAEVLLDAVADVSQVPFDFSAMPPGSRASEIWTHRIGSTFLDTFGRPDPNKDPPCERFDDPTVVQVLHLMNSPELHQKVTSDKGRPAQLASSDLSVDEVVQELYLAVYNRPPATDELDVGRQIFAREGVSRRQAAEDLMWALMNTPEFLFKD